MLNEIKTYKNDIFGPTRYLTINNDKWYVAIDSAKTLKYRNPSNAVTKHCTNIVKRTIPHPANPKKTTNVNTIAEEDVHKLIDASGYKYAEEYRSWLFDGVVPNFDETEITWNKDKTNILVGDVQFFTNVKFGKLRSLIINKDVYFVAVDAAKSLKYKKPNDAINLHCRWAVKCGIPHPQNSTKTLIVNVIPIGDLCRLVAGSDLPEAQKYESWIFDEVVPSVLKYGAYMTDKVLDQIEENPDLVIKLGTQLKAEKMRSEALDKKVQYQDNIIACFNGNTDLSTYRQRITQIMSRNTSNYEESSKKWYLLYAEFGRKHHVYLPGLLAAEADNYTPKLKNNLDVVEHHLHMLPELFEVCCKLFESDVRDIIGIWKHALTC